MSVESVNDLRKDCLDALERYIVFCVKNKEKVEICHLNRVNEMVEEFKLYSLPEYK
jgi:hypothetical protein